MSAIRFSRARRGVLAVTAAAVALVGAAAIGQQAASAATGCQVDYTVTAQWPGGFGTNVTVKNLGDPINGWRLTWVFPDGQGITQLWNGSYTQSGGQVTVTNTWNNSIPTGGTTNFGFNGTYTNANRIPSSFVLNGIACTGELTATPSTPASTATSSPATSAPATSAPATSAPATSAPATSAPATSAPATSSPATSTPPPATGPMIDNSYSVTREGAYGTNRYTVFRPSTPASVGRPMPVLVFGNGACAHTDNSEVTRALTFVAARGFVVVDMGSVNGASNGVPSGSPIPSLLTEAITWAERENARGGAALYQRLDLSKVAVAGHSCGGLEALVAAQDPRVKSVVALDSGFFADGSFGYSRSELARLHTPALFMDGGPSDIAYANNQANYDLATVPSVLARHSQAGHVGFITGSQLTAGMTVVVQFLDMTLNGNTSARTYILGPGGLANVASWTVSRKNF